MNTSQIKNFAIQSRNVLKAGVLNRIIALGFDVDGNLTVDRPVKIQGGTVFMGQLREEGFFDAWTALEERIAKHSVKEVCEEAAYTWFNRLVAIRIMQKNGFVEPVMQYASEVTRIPVIVDQARSGRLSLRMTVAEQEKLEELLRDPTKTNEQFNLLISAYCTANPVIYNCFGGIEKHIGLLLPDNILAQGGFIDMLNNTPYLTDEDYAQSELIGWLYQFYISEKKDEVFAKKGKYTPDEIPAATQIFTPNWIVKYMVENTVGRIYLDNNPYADDIKAGMKYLVEPAEPTPEDAILKIDDLTEYKMIDAACGSGHILIEGFNLFYRMYLSEGYAPRTAIENILRKNIIGLDLDTRAKQLATFALLMTAAKLDRSFLDCKVMPRVLDFPEPFVYRGGLMKEFLAHFFLGGNQRIIEETEKAFELMKQANNLGSIMKFDISPETRTAIERSTSEWEKHEFVNPDIEAAIPSMKIILALTDKYTVAAMNPPYMVSGRFSAELEKYIESFYEEGKADLFAVFMLVGMNLLAEKGKMGMINMQSWMFLGSFENLRHEILKHYCIESLLHLGPRTFDELSGEVVQNSAFCIQKLLSKRAGTYYRLIEGIDNKSKEELYLSASTRFSGVQYDTFTVIPGNPLAYWVGDSIRKIFTATVADIITTFGQPPYGWNEVATVYFLNELVRRHMRAYSYKGNPNIDKNVVAETILKDRNSYTVTTAQKIDPQLVNDFIKAWKDIFNDFSKTYSIDSTELFSQCHNDDKSPLNTTPQLYAQYSGNLKEAHALSLAKILDDATKKLGDWKAERDTEKFFKLVIAEKDSGKQMIDQCKDIISFHENQLPLFKDIYSFAKSNEDNFNFITDATDRAFVDELKEMFTDERPDQNLPKYKKRRDILRVKLDEIKKGLVKNVLDAYDAVFTELEEFAKSNGVTFDRSQFKNMVNAKTTTNNFYALQSNANVDAFKQQQIKDILDRAAKKTPPAPTPGGGKGPQPPKPVKRVYIHANQLCKAQKIRSVDELNKYVDSIRQTLINTLGDNDELIVS